jgi:uncharacterized delta-60 repeat protein
VVSPLPNDERARSLTIQPDGKIVVAGDSYDLSLTNGTDPFMVARYNAADGSLDSSFGTGGIALSTGFNVSADKVDVALEPDGRIVVAGTAPFGTSDRFALARFLAAGPQIGSFTASPSPVAVGSTVTLTAGNVVAINPGSTVTQVVFFVDSNNGGVLNAGDTLLDYGSQSSSGTWTFTFSTSGWAAASYTLFAQAEDSYGAFSDPVALALALE